MAVRNCPHGHPMEAPNLVPSMLRRSGRKACLACNRARGYLQNHPELRSHFKQVSDQYYARIIEEQK